MFRFTISFIVIAALVACQTPETNQFSDEDAVAIKNARESYDQTVRANDWANFADHFTDNAVIMPPNQSWVEGRTAILEWVETWDPTIPTTSFKGSPVEIDGHDGVGFSRGIYSQTFKVEGMRAAVRKDGKYTTVWEKQSDSSWKIRWLIWNSNTSPPKATMSDSNQD